MEVREEAAFLDTTLALVWILQRRGARSQRN